MKDKTIQAFISEHREDDVRKLAFEGQHFPHINMPFALEQIQGWQTARLKLPMWAAIDDIVYPPHINMEQCSSEVTARYKNAILAQALGAVDGAKTLVDLTGGFGVDFSFMSQGFERAVYVERSEQLCDLASHNFALLGLTQSEVACGDGVDFLHGLPRCENTPGTTVIYLDPARRGDHGQKVFGLSDCQPDVTLLRDELIDKADVVLLKLSPMLDVYAALSSLASTGRGVEVHIVSTAGECKELLLLLTHNDTPLRVVCVNDDEIFAYSPISKDDHHPVAPLCDSIDSLCGILLVPNASIMKAGCFAELASHFGLLMLDPNSHLFVAPRPVSGFPGRQFSITGVSSMNKRELRDMFGQMNQANVAVRNFPLSVAELRRRLKLRDGGNDYLFATTCAGKHIIVLCHRIAGTE